MIENSPERNRRTCFVEAVVLLYEVTGSKEIEAFHKGCTNVKRGFTQDFEEFLRALATTTRLTEFCIFFH